MSKLKDLEKRVLELENKVAKFESVSSDKTHKTHPKNVKMKEDKTKKKKKPNKFILAMNAARKEKKDKFEYNGTTYVGVKHEKFGMIYRKEK
jgi:hypothetical protein